MTNPLEENNILLDTLKQLLIAPISIALILFSSVFISLSIIHGHHIDLGIITLIYAVGTSYWRLFAKDMQFAGTYIYHVFNLVFFIGWIVVITKAV